MMTAPPSTLNTLDAEQRSRLLRSTLKLGAVLGATPLVLEVSPSPPSPRTKSFRREGRIFHSPSSSLSSIESYVVVSATSPKSTYQPLPPISLNLSTPGPSTQKQPQNKGLRPLAQPLILSLRSVPAKKHRHSPISASFPDTSVQNDRRRKMAKLTRTLGENIPPELVFGPAPNPKRSASTKPRTQKQMGSLSAPIHADEPIVLSPAPQPKKRVGRPRSLSLGSIPTPKEYPARTAASLDSPRQPSFAAQPQQWGRRGNGVHRKEREWSGEWNVQDMGDVVKALRQLR